MFSVLLLFDNIPRDTSDLHTAQAEFSEGGHTNAVKTLDFSLTPLARIPLGRVLAVNSVTALRYTLHPLIVFEI